MFPPVPFTRMRIKKSFIFNLICFGQIKFIEAMEMEIVMILGGASDSDALILDTPSTKAVELYKREEEAMKCGIFSDLCIPDVPEELHRATAIYEENENRVLVCGGGKTHNIKSI